MPTSRPDTSTPIGQRLALALDIVGEAGELTHAYFANRGFDPARKADGSFVTVADREAESLMRTRIRRAFSDDAMLGEEHGEEPGDSGYRWVIDPIDGTTSFVHGVPLYGNLVGIEHEGEVVAGVINMPELGEAVYASAGRGAWHVRRGLAALPARVSSVDTLSAAMVITTSYHYFSGTGELDRLLSISEASGDSRGWSDCYAHVLVATGRADAVIEPRLHPWDIAPGIVILREAGGRCSGWDGRDEAYQPNAVLSNGLVHEELLGHLKG